MSQPLFGNADNNIVVAINNCHSPFMDNAILYYLSSINLYYTSPINMSLIANVNNSHIHNIPTMILKRFDYNYLNK